MIAYFDCFSGISGDMTLGALVDLGISAGWLEDRLKEALGLDGFSIRAHGVERGGISGKKVDVIVSDAGVRDYTAIRALIENSRLSQFAAEKSLAMFQKIAGAEAAIHGVPEDDVHFHELGGMDAIVDVVGTAICMERMGFRSVAASRVAVGSGMVECAHGRLPVPAPATLSILTGIPVYGTDIVSELVTPTGAAILATFAQSFEPVPDMVVTGIGYGAGSRDLPRQPNMLRIITGHPETASSDYVEIVETSIDDMNPEVFGYLADRLFDAGALDVCLFPVYMKKGRPGTFLQVLCHRAILPVISRMILTETSAAGLRHHSVGRRVLERKAVFVSTPYGRVQAKEIRTPDGKRRIAPEFEECKRIALSMNLPIREVYELVMRHAEEDHVQGKG